MHTRSIYRPFVTAILLGLAACTSCAVASPAHLRPVDGSYTIAQRWAAYKDRYPGIALPDVTFEAGQQVLFDRIYKKDGDRELHIDIFLPVGVNRRQGLLLVHGGGWRSGDKSHFYALANRLAQRGYAVFLPEYRLSAESPYPTGLIDINDAIVWVKAHAEDFGIDARHLALGGASSGGQMASLLAYSEDEALYKSNPKDDTRVNALIDLDGVLDFTSPLALKYENAAGPESAAALWLGGSWEQAPQRWREASALTHLSATAPPTMIISSGLTRFTAGREAVEMRLKGFGVPYSFYSFENAPHDVWLFQPWLNQIVNKVDAFLQKEAR